jgi:hypothetical protein
MSGRSRLIGRHSTPASIWRVSRATVLDAAATPNTIPACSRTQLDPAQSPYGGESA